MSGFSASLKPGAVPEPFFLIFERCASSTRQSATAAAKTAASAGSAACTAPSISRAVSTFRTVTPSGSGAVAGPETSTTSAPRSRSAAAIAAPCRPEERFAR